jgi:prepilin-type N-terminal cleavage/methylation domain-containing protein
MRILDVGKNKITAFTLIEVLSALIIVSILAALALPQFAATRERSLSKEAKANLKLIDAAEKIYRMEEGFYYPYSGSMNSTIESERGFIYSDLKLAITNTTVRGNWEYVIRGDSAVSGNSYNTTAYRMTSRDVYLDCQYRMNNTATEPTPVTGTNCP